ncbi:MAG: tetratricopeptide repeat protein [Spirochaetia bacterium]|jgi:tetratricopeptide (TPR) repeat protein|nr:tetratricopeptide repeat protein [Spirochaetia bacterium]
MKLFFSSILLASIIITSCTSVNGIDTELTNEKKNRATEQAVLGTKFFSDSDYEKALDFYFLALKINISIDYEEGMINSYNSIGNTYFASRDIDSARIYFNKANDIAKFLNNPILKAQSLNYLGELSVVEQNYQEAIDIFTDALAMIENEGKIPLRAVILHNFGIIYKRTGDFKNAETYINESLDINKKNSLYKETASNYYTLSSIYSKQEDFITALEYIKEALIIDKQVENSLGIAKDLYAHGLIYQYLNSNVDAYIYFKKSVLIYEILGLQEEVIKTLKKHAY